MKSAEEKRIYDDAFQAAGEEGLEEEACKEAADAAVFEWKYAEARAILRRMPTFGCSENLRQDFWLGGGGGPSMQAFAKHMEADGYDTVGAWVENKAWFERYGISREEFQILVDVSG